MKLFNVILLSGCLAACTEPTGPEATCDGVWNLQDSSGGLPLSSLLVLGIASDYSASSVDLLAKDEPSCMAPNRAIGAGDAALRRLGDEAVLLNRGAASNVQFLAGAAFPGDQVSLDACNPHDVQLIDGARALITCYDSATMKIIDLSNGEVSDGPSLAGFADADGLPEMDQLVRIGDRIYVTLQLLSRPDYYAPSGNGVLVALDAATLALADVKPDVPGIQSWVLPCQNPFTDLEPSADGRLYVACSGDFVTRSLAGIAAIDPLTGMAEVVDDGDALGGFPTALRVAKDGTPYALVAGPDAFVVDDMRVVRLTEMGVEELATSPGFSLSGLAVAADGAVYFGNRSPGAAAGLWLVAPGNAAQGPFTTSLPPYELEVF